MSSPEAPTPSKDPSKGSPHADDTASPVDDLPDDDLRAGDSASVDEPTGASPEGGVQDNELVESDDPGPGLWKVRSLPPPQHIDVVRQHIAYVVVIGLLVLYAAVITVALVLKFDPDSLASYVAALSGPTSLAAAVIGFYFGQGNPKNP